MTAQLREHRDRASGLGVMPGQIWLLAAPSSSHISSFEKVEKDLGGKELKISGKADE